VRARLLLLSSLLLLPTYALGDIPPDPPNPEPPAPTAKVQVTPVRASGKRAKDAKPAIPPELEAVREVLAKATYDRYLPEGKPVSKPLKAGAGAEVFGPLPQQHRILVSWKPEPKGKRLTLTVELQRTVKDGGGGPKRLALMTVHVPDGKSYLVKCPGAWPDGDLLLVVTAKRTP
jgi:hypothetical protein